MCSGIPYSPLHWPALFQLTLALFLLWRTVVWWIFAYFFLVTRARCFACDTAQCMGITRSDRASSSTVGSVRIQPCLHHPPRKRTPLCRDTFFFPSFGSLFVGYHRTTQPQSCTFCPHRDKRFRAAQPIARETSCDRKRQKEGTKKGGKMGPTTPCI